MKDVLRMLNSETPGFGETKEKTHSTYRMDDQIREMADLVILIRSLMFGNRAETYTKLYVNLVKEELYRLKNHERFAEIIESSTKNRNQKE